MRRTAIVISAVFCTFMVLPPNRLDAQCAPGDLTYCPMAVVMTVGDVCYYYCTVCDSNKYACDFAWAASSCNLSTSNMPDCKTCQGIRLCGCCKLTSSSKVDFQVDSTNLRSKDMKVGYKPKIHDKNAYDFDFERRYLKVEFSQTDKRYFIAFLVKAKGSGANNMKKSLQVMFFGAEIVGSTSGAAFEDADLISESDQSNPYRRMIRVRDTSQLVFVTAAGDTPFKSSFCDTCQPNCCDCARPTACNPFTNCCPDNSSRFPFLHRRR